VKKFADETNSQEERIDYLILNAGIFALPEMTINENGWEQ